MPRAPGKACPSCQGFVNGVTCPRRLRECEELAHILGQTAAEHHRHEPIVGATPIGESSCIVPTFADLTPGREFGACGWFDFESRGSNLRTVTAGSCFATTQRQEGLGICPQMASSFQA